jgi:hypothetical protein
MTVAQLAGLLVTPFAGSDGQGHGAVGAAPARNVTGVLVGERHLGKKPGSVGDPIRLDGHVMKASSVFDDGPGRRHGRLVFDSVAAA